MKDFPFEPYDFFGYLASGFLIIAGLEILIGVPQVFGKSLQTFDILILTLSAYIFGQIIATPAKFILEDIIIKRLLSSPSETLMRGAEEKSIGRFLLPGYYAPLPGAISTRIRIRSLCMTSHSSNRGALDPSRNPSSRSPV